MGNKSDRLQSEINHLAVEEVQNFSGITTFDVDTDKPIELLKIYDSAEWLQCSCGKKQPHKQGCLVLFSNGNCGLIGGSTCAVREFGQESWDSLQASYAALQKDKIHKAYLKPYLDIGEKNLRYCLWAAEKLRKIEDFFKDISPSLYSFLLSGSTDKVINAYDLYNSKSQGVDPKKLQKILGRSIIGLNYSEENRIAARLIKKGLDTLTQENIKKEEFAVGRKCIYDGTKLVSALPSFFDAAELFFMPINFSNIANLANAHLSRKNGNYQISDNKLFLPYSKVVFIPFGMNFSFAETIPTLAEFKEIKIDLS